MLFLAWPQDDPRMVLGVQGRYFIPIFPLLAYGLYAALPGIKKIPVSIYYTAAVIISLFISSYWLYQRFYQWQEGQDKVLGSISKRKGQGSRSLVPLGIFETAGEVGQGSRSRVPFQRQSDRWGILRDSYVFKKWGAITSWSPCLFLRSGRGFFCC